MEISLISMVPLVANRIYDTYKVCSRITINLQYSFALSSYLVSKITIGDAVSIFIAKTIIFVIVEIILLNINILAIERPRLSKKTNYSCDYTGYMDNVCICRNNPSHIEF